MRSPWARFAAVAVVAVSAMPVLARAAPVKTWVAAPVALDETTPAETVARLGELWTAALAARPELALAAPAPTSAAPDLAAARASLAAGREAYQKFQFAASARELEHAIVLVTQAGVPAGEAQTLVDALVELATVEEMSGRHADAAATCEALMVLRPDVALDPVRVPPRAIQTCEAARRRRSGDVRRVTLSAVPPFRQLFVDGQPYGAAPVTVTLAVGRHFLHVTAADGAVRALPLDVVAGGGAPQEVPLALPVLPAHQLAEALRARVRRRGPLPQTLEAASALATVAEVEQVIASGVERAGGERWRLWAAAIDPRHPGAPVVALAELADDLSDAPAQLALLAAALDERRTTNGEAHAGHGVVRVGAAELPGALDLGAALFGRAPPTAGAGLAGGAPSVRRERALPKHLWWWVGGAAVVAAAAVTVGLTVGLDNGKLRISY